MIIARQRLDKYVPAETNSRATRVDPYRRVQYKMRFHGNRQATDMFHGYR
jgi:hypothetical protein